MNQDMIREFVLNAHGNFEKVKEIYAEHPYVLNESAPWKETALEAASHTASKEIAAWLLEQGAPLDIFAAMILGMDDEVKRFLADDPALAHASGAHGIPIPFYPAIVGRQDYAQLLLDAGTNVNMGAGGNTALHGCAWFNQPEMAAWLIAKGADVSPTDYQGKTPLAIASEKAPAVAEVLRAHGAD